MERDKTIAMCRWEACLECGKYDPKKGCIHDGELELSQDGDSILCESSTDPEPKEKK